MSMLSKFLHQVGDFLSTASQKAGADQQAQLADAASKATAAAQAAESVLPTLAKVIADDALAAIPGFGAYVPALNDFIDILAAELLSRKSVKA